MADSLTVASFCTGVGMLDEAVRLGCDYFGRHARTALYCEWESYAAAVLLARMEDASLEPAPIYCGDLADFDSEPFAGRVDLLTAGFPCQPWSCAGQQRGIADERWLWDDLHRIIVQVQPALVFLENVPGLVSGGGLHHVLGSLAKGGFNAEWLCLSAASVGASHRRERVFILAYDPSVQWRAIFGGEGEELAESARRRLRELRESTECNGQPDGGDGVVGTAGSKRTSESRSATSEQSGQQSGRPAKPRRRRTAMGNAECDGQRSGGRRATEVTNERLQSILAPGPQAEWNDIPQHLWPAIEPGFHVLANGLAVVVDESRADQLRCAGNGVVATCAATAFVELVRRAMKWSWTHE